MTLPLPHDGVVVRLGVSAINGIGVFAGEPIRAGTIIFANDRRPIRWTPAGQIDTLDLTSFQRAFYRDFAVRRDGMLGTPESFDLLSVGWYVNEPEAGSEANLRPADDLTFVAARDIAAGEELTIRYDDFASSDELSSHPGTAAKLVDSVTSKGEV